MNNEQFTVNNENVASWCKVDTRRGRLLITAFFTLLFSFFSCSVPFFELPETGGEVLPQAPAGMGYFSLNIDSAARTILPTAPVFQTYKLNFVPNVNCVNNNPPMDAIYIPAENSTNVNTTVTLRVGIWDLVVTAYTDAGDAANPPGDNTAVASGDLRDITIEAGGAAGGTVPLSPIEKGEGTFRWTITFPGNVTSGTMIVTPFAGGTGKEITLTGASASVDTKLDSGYYEVNIALQSSDGKKAFITRTLHIQTNMVSVFSHSFSASNFFAELGGTVTITGNRWAGETLTATTNALSGTTGNIYYQWKRGGANIENEIASTYTITSADTVGTQITVEVYRAGYTGSVTSAAVVVTVTPPPVITISSHPDATTTVTQGNISGSLSVTASVAPAATLTYQWYRNDTDSNDGGTSLSGTNNATFTIPTNLTEGTYYYFCEVRTVGAVSVRSSPAEVIVESMANHIFEYLDSQTGGDAPNNPVTLLLDIPLTAANWQAVLEAIEAADIFVELDLSDCTGSFSVGSIATGKDKIVSLVLPDSATSISGIGSSNADQRYFTNLQSVSGKGITTISSSAFEGCINLTSVDFPVATSIGIGAFANCSSLTEAYFPKVTSIRARAFDQCTSLKNAYFPLATSIEMNAFSFTGTVPLTITLGSKAPTVGVHIFNGTSGKDVTVQVPADAEGYGSNPTNTTDQNWGNAFRGMGWDGTNYLDGGLSGITLDIKYAGSGNTDPPVITISSDPTATTTVTQGSITGSLTVAASVTPTATPTYQWYSNTSASNVGGTFVDGATSASFVIPTILAAGTYFYFCEVSAPGAASVRSEVAVVNVSPLLDMVQIPATGDVGFQMGQADLTNSTPVRTVKLSAFKMSRTPVTQEQFQKVMGYNPSNFNGGPGMEPAAGEVQEKRPVERVTWFDAVEFCNELSLLEGLNPVYTFSGDIVRGGHENKQIVNTNAQPLTVTAIWSNNGYRLPTEAEWEYACRAGITTEYYWGSVAEGAEAQAGTYAWYYENSGSMTHEVGLKTENNFGLRDMSGNVWEWVWDWYAAAYSENPDPDPRGPSSGSNRVYRGGSWGWGSNPVEELRSAIRYGFNPGNRSSEFGFRVVRQ